MIVDDQDKALCFYAEVLCFVKKKDMPVGKYRWLTVVSPDRADDIELLLEPNAYPASQAYQEAPFEKGIPLPAFAVEHIQKEYERLKKLDVVFRSESVSTEPTTIAAFENTCGNMMQLFRV